jgi:hypothetical protein
VTNIKGRLEEMDSWFVRERREAGKKWLREMFGNILDIKTEGNDDDETEENYNVSVYRMLPYPPNTKDVKDFFIQRN